MTITTTMQSSAMTNEDLVPATDLGLGPAYRPIYDRSRLK